MDFPDDKLDDDDQRAVVLAIFAGREEEYGKPEAPTQAGFLALARAGKEVWNTWRERWVEPNANFSDVNFLDSPIRFSGFVFGDGANFSRAQFGDRTYLTGAVPIPIRPLVFFDGAKFGDYATFQDAQFWGWSTFILAQFGDWVSFESAQFHGLVQLHGARFGHVVSFEGAQFRFGPSFNGAHFGQSPVFRGTQFGNFAEFEGVGFGDRSTFQAMSGNEIEAFWQTHLRDWAAVQRHRTFAKRYNLRSDIFPGMAFRGAQFNGEVTFEGREFQGSTDFGPTDEEEEVALPPDWTRTIPACQPVVFHGIPNFHGCKLHQETSFEAAVFRAPPSMEAARAYRTLKLAMAQQQAIREEQKFFALEMDAERGSSTGMRYLLFAVYRLLANYGFSLWRPFIFWLSGLIVFGLIEGVLAGPPSLRHGIDWTRTSQWGQYAFLNSIPLPGFEKIQEALRADLFGPDKGLLLKVTTIDLVHKICALIAIFLAGLALRNLFKMKG